MEKQTQLELFKFKHSAEEFKRPRYRPNFFDFIRIYEKAISIIIVFFIVSLISFSLGVERGKRFSGIANTKTDKIIAQQPQTPSDEIPAVSIQAEEKKDTSNKYTVQVATFKTKNYAQKEANRLEKKGLQALIISKGKYVCVCVGRFSGKQEAKITLNQLKNTYQDCFIRRL